MASEYFAITIAEFLHKFYNIIALRAMDINALVISGSDLGAVPSGSTIYLSIADIWGRNRIDERVKEIALSRRDATVIGAKSTIANDNRAPVAMAA